MLSNKNSESLLHKFNDWTESMNAEKILIRHTTARNTIFSFSRRPEKMVFPEKPRRNMIFRVLSGKMIFLFPEHMILHLGRKLKDDLPQNNTRKYDIFFKPSENMVFSKRAAPGPDFFCVIWKDGIFSRKHDIFSLARKWGMTFLKKYVEMWYFLCTRTGVTNMVPRPSVKKIKDGLIPQKYT